MDRFSIHLPEQNGQTNASQFCHLCVEPCLYRLYPFQRERGKKTPYHSRISVLVLSCVPVRLPWWCVRDRAAASSLRCLCVGSPVLNALHWQQDDNSSAIKRPSAGISAETSNQRKPQHHHHRHHHKHTLRRAVPCGAVLWCVACCVSSCAKISCYQVRLRCLCCVVVCFRVGKHSSYCK